MEQTDLKITQLHEVHKQLNAKLVNFGGYEMPLSYGTGTIQEHMACRTGAVMFDVSHLGTVHKTNSTAYDDIQNTFTNDLNKIHPGKCQYTHLLNDEGNVVDDVILWWLNEENFYVMPNASNTENVLNAVGGVDITADRSVIALQGPNSRNLLSKVLVEASQVPFNEVKSLNYAGNEIVVAGTGYTGEDGVEIHVPNSLAQELFLMLNDVGFIPAGLGARDTLRLEAGLPLYGHEISLARNSIQANLSWVIAFNKDKFIGKEAIMRIKDEGFKQKLYGLIGQGRKPLRERDQVFLNDRNIGEVVSGNYSPVLNSGIATAYIDIDSDINFGDSLTVRSRSTEIICTVARLPFVKHNRRQKKESLI